MSLNFVAKSVFVVGALASLGLAPAVEAASLQPHQAQYHLAAKRVKMRGAVGATDGLFVMRLQRRCTDWVLLSRLSIGVDLNGDRRVRFESVSSVEESLDGHALEFESETRVNDQLVDTLEGVARLEPEGGGVAEISVPEDRRVRLPAGTMFPVDAFEDTIKRIAGGERFINYILFDGSGPEPMRGSDVVIGPAKPLETAPDGDTGLIEGQGWRVVTSFYEMDATDTPPAVTNVADAYRNGVASRLMLDLGVIEVEGTLTSVQALPMPEC